MPRVYGVLRFHGTHSSIRLLLGREFVQRVETKKAKESNPKCEIDIQVLDYVPNTTIVSARDGTLIYSPVSMVEALVL